MTITKLRTQYHKKVCDQIIRVSSAGKAGVDYPNFADASNMNSIKIAKEVVRRLGCGPIKKRSRNNDKEVGVAFEEQTKEFLNRAFALLIPIRPGEWYFARHVAISDFDQYAHLAEYTAAMKRFKVDDKSLHDLFQHLLGHDYIIAPDIIVSRSPLEDDSFNQGAERVIELKDTHAKYTPLRKANSKTPRGILHASISCKWTVRSDRAQNTRTEALNLIRNRKGNLPHIVAITAEPLPTRIASLALGTGDLDCVYHFALPELEEAVKAVHAEDQLDMLNDLIQGRRLRDIADLVFDLAV